MIDSKNDSLRDLQAHIWCLNIERKFNTDDPSKKMVVLMEEVGELAKAIRKAVGLKFTESTKTTELAEEIADVQIVLLGLASMLKINVFDAVVSKTEKDNARAWLETH